MCHPSRRVVSLRSARCSRMFAAHAQSCYCAVVVVFAAGGSSRPAFNGIELPTDLGSHCQVRRKNRNPCAVADGDVQASRLFLRARACKDACAVLDREESHHARESKKKKSRHQIRFVMKLIFFAEVIEKKQLPFDVSSTDPSMASSAPGTTRCRIKKDDRVFTIKAADSGLSRAFCGRKKLMQIFFARENR